MKSNRTKILLAGITVMLTAVPAWAQTLSSSYFLPGAYQRHELNPALMPERSYLALPALGQIGVDAASNVGLGNFLFEPDGTSGDMVTFMSSRVGADEFLNKMPAHGVQVSAAADLGILNLGVKGKNGFTTFSINLRNKVQVAIPKELFSFMKAGLSEGNYLIEDINVNALSYAEVAIGHSHNIGENLRTGLKLKGLVGVGYADVNVDQIDARFSEDSWKVRTAASGRFSLSNSKFEIDPGADVEIDGIDVKVSTPSGMGIAADLGAEYDMKDIVKGLKLSAALTDLGFIKWSNMNLAGTNYDGYVEFDGFNDYDPTDENDESVDDTMEKLEDDFKEMIKIYDKGSTTQLVTLSATARLGADYDIPVKGLSTGLLLTHRFGTYKYSEARLALNYSPGHWIDFTVNGAYTTYGEAFGWMINIHPTAFGFFIGSDMIKANVNPQYIPVDSFRANLMLGMNIPFGRRYWKEPKVKTPEARKSKSRD